MTAQREKPDPGRWALHVTFEPPGDRRSTGWSDTSYGHIRARVVREEQYLMDYSTPYYLTDGCTFSEVTASCQVDTDHLRRRPLAEATYAWRVEWRENDRDLRSLERGVKALRPLERKLERYTRDEGRCDSFGRYLLRVARALGIARMVFNHEGDSNGHRYRRTSLGDGMAFVDYTVTTWWREAQPEPEEAR
jgi:hypothetical protein